MLNRMYAENLGTLTDLYQLTMAYGYWKSGIADREAVFHLFFRDNPFGGGYAVCCGLDYVIDFLDDFHFTDDDIDYLASIEGNDKKPLFSSAFLDYLRTLRFTGALRAVPEGVPVFANEPIVQVQGSIIECQVIETALLNIINFQTLIATKAARVCRAAEGDPVLEFGLRRAQGIDGGVTAARAAFIGGCAATSNVLAGKLFDIPVKGTHAHSWVMCFENELESFLAYADAMPHNCILLVDTYETLGGVRNAIKAGKRLRAKGVELAGVRLDSGDLADLGKKARAMLDEAGFQDTKIVASNDLDEYAIEALKQQNAPIDIWGVGTRLTTSRGQSALNGVYKLAAIRTADGSWKDKLKLSDDPGKTTNPGVHQVRRYIHKGNLFADMIYRHDLDPGPAPVIIDQSGDSPRLTVPPDAHFRDLLQPVFVEGRLVYRKETPAAIRNRFLEEQKLLPEHLQCNRPDRHYPVGLEAQLHTQKMELMKKAGSQGEEP